LMGHPSYKTSGEISIDGHDIGEASPDERSKKGLFLSFQHPLEIPGVTISNFLRTAINSRLPKEKQIKLLDFMPLLNKNMELLHIPKEFASRYVNEGFSGGEKKKMEILQLLMLKPKAAILDETDSGLDIDALRKVCEGINILKSQDPDMTLLVITHYQRILHYLKPDRICIMKEGKLIKIGGSELVTEIEEKGYT
jgi:Fe-S cluster assembly ATP-binding protein